jgi:gliding motility-associated lipoprotein GldH
MGFWRKINYWKIMGMLCASTVGWSCQRDVQYEAYHNFQGMYWHADSVVYFQFEVEDVSKPYDLSYRVRNSLAYPYYNLYIKYELSGETGQIIRANMHEAILMEPKTGKPLGVGVGDLYDHKILLLENMRFEAPGIYRFSMNQYMRPDSLPSIFAVGVTLEPVKP